MAALTLAEVMALPIAERFGQTIRMMGDAHVIVPVSMHTEVQWVEDGEPILYIDAENNAWRVIQLPEGLARQRAG